MPAIRISVRLSHLLFHLCPLILVGGPATLDSLQLLAELFDACLKPRLVLLVILLAAEQLTYLSDVVLD